MGKEGGNPPTVSTESKNQIPGQGKGAREIKKGKARQGKDRTTSKADTRVQPVQVQRGKRRCVGRKVVG